MCLVNETILEKNNDNLIGYVVALENPDNTFSPIYFTPAINYMNNEEYTAENLDQDLYGYIGFHGFETVERAMKWMCTDLIDSDDVLLDIFFEGKASVVILKCQFRSLIAKGFQPHISNEINCRIPAFKAKYIVILSKVKKLTYRNKVGKWKWINI
jgi:hypothetical protein